MLGYLIDEEEFQVKPAIARVTQLFEIDAYSSKNRRNKDPKNWIGKQISLSSSINLDNLLFKKYLNEFRYSLQFKS